MVEYMRFVSLHGPGEAVSFSEALARGIPPDGGLYYPEDVPLLSPEQVASLPELDTKAIDRLMLGSWLGDEVTPDELASIVDTAATFPTPVCKVADKYVLELFHGPTLAFKDVAARYLAALISHFNAKSGRISTVLVATSGDTGGAVAHGFGDVPGVRVVVLYPKGRVSELQREQLRRTANNVHTVEVDGDFDNCQALVKQAFADAPLAEEAGLTSANSISIGRLIPQTLYYARAYAQVPQPNLRFAVPCGNLGNLTAGVMAQQMGVPINSFLAVNNQNDALYRYSNRGWYRPLKTVSTISNAMDVGAPNNMPRLQRLFNGSVRHLRSDIQVARISDQETAATIASVYADTGYLLDPHTAVAWSGCEEFPAYRQQDVVVATASPLKFSEEIVKLTGIKVDNSHELNKLRTIPERFTELPNTIEALAAFIRALDKF